MIIKFVYETYIDKFSLFKHVFENKEQNEEIKIMVDISQPMTVPPLKEALYLGYEFQPGEQDLQDDPSNSLVTGNNLTADPASPRDLLNRLPSSRSRIAQSARLRNQLSGDQNYYDESIEEDQDDKEKLLIDKIAERAKIDFMNQVGGVEKKFQDKLEGDGGKKKPKK